MTPAQIGRAGPCKLHEQGARDLAAAVEPKNCYWMQVRFRQPEDYQKKDLGVPSPNLLERWNVGVGAV